jgi:hypothetical protein
MGFWNDDPADKKRYDESVQRLKDSWGKLEGDLRRRGDDERAWYTFLDDVARDPLALENKSEIELDHLRIRAQAEIDTLKGKLQTGEALTDKLSTSLRSRPSSSAFADLFTALGGSVVNSVQGRVEKNNRLLELIRLKQLRDRPQQPTLSRSQQLAQELAEREAARQEEISVLEKMRDEQIAKYPNQRDSIERRFRKMIDAVMERD